MGGLSKAKWALLGSLIVVLVFMTVSVFAPVGLTNTIRGVANNDFAEKLRGLPEPAVPQEGAMIEMVVDSVRISDVGFQPVVVLKEKGGNNLLPIWIGLLEANAISVALEGAPVRRPLTSDLLCSIIHKTGANVEYIAVNDLRDNIFYAYIYVKANWTRTEIDARPSDAIAIALRLKAPIYVARTVLEKSGIPPEPETDKPTIMRLKR